MRKLGLMLLLLAVSVASWTMIFRRRMALKEAHDLRAWEEWAPELQRREAEALAHAADALAEQIENQKYRQWQIFEQWLAVKTYANERSIRIIGDIPIFVALDSTDVWANPHLFHFDQDLQPTVVSGVPPDYFSETGQRWGNPLYRWDAMEDTGYSWWIDRVRSALRMVDIIRLDHFRGFEKYWSIPAHCTTAVEGQWIEGPGDRLFQA